MRIRKMHWIYRLIGLILCFQFYALSYRAQQPAAAEPLPRKQWDAEWISHPNAPLREPRVFHFRKVIQISGKPAHYLVHVSADNRFIFYLNGKRIGEGPARGDLAHWRYETFDLGPSLVKGENLLAATVWQFGLFAPLAQISDRAAFLVQGDSGAESAANTNESWQVEEEAGHNVLRREADGFYYYWAAGPGERIDATRYDWDWNEKITGPDSHYLPASPSIRESIYQDGSVAHSKFEGPNTPWMLIPDPLPPMEYVAASVGKVVRTDMDALREFPQKPVTIPINTHTKLLLDRKTLVTAYPTLVVSGGKSSHIRLTYSESLYDSNQKRGNRNDVGDRRALGLFDEFFPDGGSSRSFTPLWWRTWRYAEIDIATGADPLTLNGMDAHSTAYPFLEAARFASNDPELGEIWDICWRTARLDAHETYMDTAFWEQLQYVGDTRVQSLISYVISGDDRLARQALRAIDDSRVPEGITQSRYPSSLPQFIPPFSLLWINMLHDYWIYRPDPAIVAELLPDTRPVLDWFLRRQEDDGFLGVLPYWNYVDSSAGIRDFPPADSDGKSAILSLQLIAALRDAADLEEAFGDPSLAEKYRRKAELAAEGIYRRCWDAKLGLLADTPGQTTYSQHANLLGVLLDVIPQRDHKKVMKQILASDLNPSGAQGSVKVAHVGYYFQFYMSRALEHAGLGQYYLDLLQPWRQMLALGLTTTPEFPEPSRSDSHAWSAHPIYDLATIVGGIHPDAPGFKKVRISPSLGLLNSLDVSIPHPYGTLLTSYRRTSGALDATIILPDELSGVFVWDGKEYAIHPGSQTLHLPDNDKLFP